MRIVVKVGTSTLAHSTGNINIRHVEELCKVLSDLKNAGHEIILVSSGAVEKPPTSVCSATAKLALSAVQKCT